eukprot:COSAG02_NODE_6160_length_3756_cov_752.237080_1_plen_768_part_10
MEGFDGSHRAQVAAGSASAGLAASGKVAEPGVEPALSTDPVVEAPPPPPQQPALDEIHPTGEVTGQLSLADGAGVGTSSAVLGDFGGSAAPTKDSFDFSLDEALTFPKSGIGRGDWYSSDSLSGEDETSFQFAEGIAGDDVWSGDGISDTNREDSWFEQTDEYASSEGSSSVSFRDYFEDDDGTESLPSGADTAVGSADTMFCPESLLFEAAPAPGSAGGYTPSLASAMEMPQHETRTDVNPVWHARPRALGAQDNSQSVRYMAAAAPPHSVSNRLTSQRTSSQSEDGLGRPTPLFVHGTSSQQPGVRCFNPQGVLKLALECGEQRKRDSMQQLWKCVEELLHDETHAFEPRPPVLDTDCAVFREDKPMIRRGLGTGADKWENSGGKKGSTMWPVGDKPARLRRQYGKVIRSGQEPLRFQLFTIIEPPGEPSPVDTASAQRRLYIVIPRKLRGPDKKLKLKQGNAAFQTTLACTTVVSEVNALVVKVKKGAGSQIVEDINVLHNVYELLAKLSTLSKPLLDALKQHHRPLLLSDSLDRYVFIEPAGKRREANNANEFDRWSNMGGKRAVVQVNLSADRVMQKRAGRVERHPPIAEAPHAPQSQVRYHQFSLGSKKVKSAYVFIVYRQAQEPSESSAKRNKRVAQTATMFGSSHKKTRRAMSATAVVASAFVLVALVGLLTRSTGYGSSFSSDNSIPCAENFYLFTNSDEVLLNSGDQTKQCVRCTECGLGRDHDSASIQRRCTANSDTVCRPWVGDWQRLDMKDICNG